MQYFVDPFGNDAADGRSPGTPWKTLDRVKNVALAPRDSVLFKRGSVWTGRGRMFSFSQSGAPDGLITFGAYGVGARPLFLLDPNTVAGEQQGFVVSGDYVGLKSLRVSLVHPFRSPTGREPDGQNVKLGWYLGFNIAGKYILVDDCEADHLSVGINLTDTAYDCRVMRNYVHNLDTFWRIDGAAGAMGAIAIMVHGNDHEIAYNSYRNCWAECVRVSDGLRQTYAAPFEVYNCNRGWFHHNIADFDPNDSIDLGFRKSFETGFGTGFTCDDNIIEDNLFASRRPYARGPNIHGPAAFGPCRRNILRHNTIALSGDGSEAMVIGTGADGNQVYDNILVAPAPAPSKSIFLGAGGGTEHHNLYFGGQVQIVNGTMSPTSKKINPLLDANYIPMTGSPAIGMATDAGTVGARLTQGVDLMPVVDELKVIESTLRTQAAAKAAEAAALLAQADKLAVQAAQLKTFADSLATQAASNASLIDSQ